MSNGCAYLTEDNHFDWGFSGGSVAKNLPVSAEVGWGDPQKKEMATYYSILAREILWTEEPGRLQSMGSQESDTTKRLNVYFDKLLIEFSQLSTFYTADFTL